MQKHMLVPARLIQRAYTEELLLDVLEGRIGLGRVFDRVMGLDGVPDGYRVRDELEAI